MYPRWMEIVGYVYLAVIGILVFLILISVEGFYLGIGEIVSALLISIMMAWASERSRENQRQKNL